MLAGVVLGPHTPGFDLVDDPAELALVARLGLVFLLFYLGLEFSLDELTSGGRRLAAAAGVYLVLNIGGGLGARLRLGWGASEAFVVAGIVGISSSAIVTKLLVETRRLGNPETRVILGIVVIEDLFLAFYLALLQPVLGGAAGPVEAAHRHRHGVRVPAGARPRRPARHAVGEPAHRHPRRGDRRRARPRPGDQHRGAWASTLGVSDAIGAFMIGLILAATPNAQRLRDLTHPLRDGFGAIFFFHFGLTIDLGDVAHRGPSGPAWRPDDDGAARVAAGVVAARLHGFGRDRRPPTSASPC